MEITWYGSNCVGLREREVTVLYDPFQTVVEAEAATLFEEAEERTVWEAKEPGFDVDIVVCSARESAPAIQAMRGDPKVFATPGEFEARGVYIQSLKLESPDPERPAAGSIRLAQHFDFGLSTVTHVGVTGAAFRAADRKLVDALLAKKTDILILPLGQGENLDLEWAARMCRRLAPKQCIPVDYDVAELERILPQLQALGQLAGEPQKRFRTTKKEEGDGGMSTCLLTVSDISRP